MHMSQQSAIYLISWTNNHYFYVGQAQNFNKRKNAHLTCLRRKCHHNKKLQNVFNKYGVPNFHIIEDCEIEELDQREQFYLDLLFDQPECLNLTNDASSPNKGRKASEETLKKLRGRKAWNKGKVLTEKEKEIIYQTNTQKRKVLQCSKDGTLIKEWSSISLAARELSISRAAIGKVCKGVKLHKSAGGFIWKYKDH